jgi:glycine cleavage system transcriptional repressor
MKKHAVLSALGRDRVGVANDMTAALTRRKLEIEDSRWTALKGQFALILQVGGDTGDIASLQRDLTAFGAELGFHLEMEPIEVAEPHGSELCYLIEGYSTGPSGVGAVTGLLKRQGINIEELETEASAEPWTSRLTFHLRARIRLPSSRSIDTLTEELRQLKRERDLDVVIKPEMLKVHA